MYKQETDYVVMSDFDMKSRVQELRSVQYTREFEVGIKSWLSCKYESVSYRS